MKYSELRELMHLRHELRQMSLSPAPAVEIASGMLERMSALAASDPDERACVVPEVERWRFRLGLAERVC